MIYIRKFLVSIQLALSFEFMLQLLFFFPKALITNLEKSIATFFFFFFDFV